ncbi:hypothetical protein D3C72_1375910 [compost metagenome]
MRMSRMILAKAASCSSFHRPVSAQEMRPAASTPVASITTRPAPDRAMRPMCWACQGWGTPSMAEYWHMGATTMRFFSVSGPTARGVNSRLMRGSFDDPGRRETQ